MSRRRPLTSSEAAKLAGVTQAGFQSRMAKLRKTGLDLRRPVEEWPDKRTPLWDAARLQKWLDDRPGSGNWRAKPER